MRPDMADVCSADMVSTSSGSFLAHKCSILILVPAKGSCRNPSLCQRSSEQHSLRANQLN